MALSHQGPDSPSPADNNTTGDTNGVPAVGDNGVVLPPPPPPTGPQLVAPPPPAGGLLPPPPADVDAGLGLPPAPPPPAAEVLLPPPAGATGPTLPPPPAALIDDDGTSDRDLFPGGSNRNPGATSTTAAGSDAGFTRSEGLNTGRESTAPEPASTTVFATPAPAESGLDTFAPAVTATSTAPSVDPSETTRFPAVEPRPSRIHIGEPLDPAVTGQQATPTTDYAPVVAPATQPAPQSSTARVVLRVLSAGALITAGGCIALFVMPSVFHVMWPIMWAVIALLGVVAVGALCEVFFADRFLGFVVSTLGIIGGLAAAACGVALLDAEEATFNAVQSSQFLQLLLLLAGAGAALALCSVFVLAAAAATRRR